MEKLRLSQETGFAVHMISTSSSTSTSHDTLVRPGEGIDNSLGSSLPRQCLTKERKTGLCSMW